MRSIRYRHYTLSNCHKLTVCIGRAKSLASQFIVGFSIYRYKGKLTHQKAVRRSANLLALRQAELRSLSFSFQECEQMNCDTIALRALMIVYHIITKDREMYDEMYGKSELDSYLENIMDWMTVTWQYSIQRLRG